MTISERIYEIIESKGMTKREFSDKTGIAQSTISDWKKKGTNPSSEKILIICEVLNVSPYYLLSGVETVTNEKEGYDYVIIDKNSEEALVLEKFSNLKSPKRTRLLGYLDALCE